MSKQPSLNEIDQKWVKEDNHIFSAYPNICIFGSAVRMEEGTWLELAQYYHDDLLWLLSLDHHQFWSHMIYSDNARQCLVSFLKDSPPSYLKNGLLVKEDMWELQNKIEHLVFLVYLRLCSKNEAVKNLGETLYNNYLFTVPVLLDICLIYGTSNRDLVGKMINEVIALAPDFLDDLKEIVPYFFRVLRLAMDRFSVEHLPKLTDKPQLKSGEIRDFVYFLHDSVANVEIFLELYPKACDLFRKSEHIAELVYFYSNVLPEVHSQGLKIDSRLRELMENTRIDLLKIIKSIFDYVLRDKTEETVDEYLTLMMELLSEPTFLCDYNLLFSVEFEIEFAVKNCPSVDTIKIKHILDGIVLVASEGNKEPKNATGLEPNDSNTKLNSLITEVKDIFPHLETDFIKRCLKYYNSNSEMVIAAVLENSIPPQLKEAEPEPQVYKPKHENVKELLNDREELSEVRDRYAQLSYVDDTYDDEYDDTYDENVDVAVKETMDESVRRPFVTPRVLRGAEEKEESEEDEDEKEEPEVNLNHFVENPEVVRERTEQRRREKRDVVGRGKGQGQSKQVTRNREYKEAHKSRVANHNRKKQASRKMGRGMVPS